MNLRFLPLLLLWLCVPGVCHAYLDKDVHLLNMQNGLADNTVSSIYKDKAGFIWFGTRNGLSRYNGRQVTNFEQTGIRSGVSDIKEVLDGLLAFIGDEVLYAFDPKKESFLPVVTPQGKPVTTRAVLPKNDSLLYILSDKELLLMKRVSSEKNSLSLVPYSRWEGNRHPFAAMAYSSDKKTLCLVDVAGRIVLLDCETMKTVRTIEVEIQKDAQISSVLYDEEHIWISTVVHGIIHYNVRTGKITRLTYSKEPAPDRLTHTDVFSVVRLGENKYLAATWNGYTLLNVSKDDPDKIVTETYDNSSSLMYRSLETRMLSAYYDSYGILWIGTDGGGVIWSDLRMQFYNRFYQDRHNEICSIVMDDDDNIWLATFHKGIMRSLKEFDVAGKMAFSSVGTEEVKKKETVLCALKDEDGNLWFGNQDGTLTCYQKQTRSFRTVLLTEEGGGVNRTSVWSLLIDSEGRFWVGTYRGVLLFDRRTGLCKRLEFSTEASDSLSPLFVRAMAETADHTIWLGTANYGICKVVGTDRLKMGYERESGLPGGSVRSLLVSSDGNLYIGYMTGFAVFSPRKDTITRFYTTKDGLCNDFIGCMTEDGQGRIWLGSSSGISRYSRSQHVFYNYYIGGSNRSALCFGNILFWGNNRNLTCFNPDDINSFSTSGTVTITNLEINNKPVEIGKKENGQVILSQSIFYTSEIKLNYRNRNFSLTFNNLSYSENQQKYSYRLYPYQHDWVMTDGDEKVSYANLPAGKYMFEVRNVTPDDQESRITRLAVIISPHWSQTVAFRLVAFVLVGMIVWLFVRRLKLRQRRLEHELQLEHEVFTANMERDKEKQIRVERENFFTNAAHELRTPLTLILSPLQELLYSTPVSDPVYEKLSTMYRNGSFLHTLVDQLLYVQKIEAGMIKLNISEADLGRIVQEVADTFKPLAESRALAFVVRLPEVPLLLWMDVEKITSAVRNILSNAFKYTSPDGRIELEVGQVETDGKLFGRIIVSDTGKGIPEELQERIFDSFITGENTPLLSTKVGIGLRIVKNTMDLHHGSVTLQSGLGKGTTFTLLIPGGNAHFADDECETGYSPVVEKVTTFPPLAPVVLPEEDTPHQKTLLVIEDNDEVRRYIVSLFCKNYAVYEAGNGEEGVRMAVEKRPDLIISDIMMPVKDGFACCREIKEQSSTAHIPILMLTAKAEDVDILQASSIGADDYMMKPFNPEILKSKVANLISQRERLKRIYTKTLMLRQQSALPDGGKVEELDGFIQKVIQVIEAHLSDEAFNVKLLAEQLNMSQPTLYRKIKQRSELNAIDMIRSIRMSKAASLIMENRYTIQQIAEMVGYSDVRTLRKHFMEQFGVSPSKYMEKE